MARSFVVGDLSVGDKSPTTNQAR